MKVFDVSVTYGFGDGICHMCEADYSLHYCHLYRINTCDSCLRAAFDVDEKGCGSCSYIEYCSIPFEYSDMEKAE